MKTQLVFVTNVWSWQNRRAARKHLRSINQSKSLDMAFLQLRGSLIDALQKHDGYTAADSALAKFKKENHMSNRRLKAALQVIGLCLTSATEEFSELRNKLKNRNSCANRTDVKKYKHLRALLVCT